MPPLIWVDPCIGPDNGFPLYSIEALILSRIWLLPTVGSENMCDPIIRVAVKDIKEEDLWIELAIYTGPTGETHFLHLAIPVYISQLRAVE